MCNFCRHRGTNEHYQSCTRNAPDAQEQYDKGWLDGRQGRDRTSDNAAYTVGWNRGESALEDYLESYNWYGV